MAELLVAPSWLLILAVFAVPILVAFYLSFRNETLGAFIPGQFVGLQNYSTALTDARFWEAIGTTCLLTVMGLVVQVPTGIALALLIEKNLLGTQMFRTALMVPMLLTPVAVGLIWRFMFDADLGIVNWALGIIGIHGPNWLGGRWPALMAVTIVDSWQSIPFIMLTVLAALVGLSKGPAEAAAIDGANTFQIFFYVTLPSLQKIILLLVMIRIIDSLKMFDLIFIVTSKGGPGTATQTLGMLVYNTGFGFFQTSRAAALGVLMVILVSPIYWLWRRAAREQ
ncbi:MULTISPECIES: sugar ABC transporter permease [unclassified Mesorhizobium]|uniref:carbohydrate ABC transporter permease n=1 Tax=unclassified Mesorhizobium TaxID=325217 RepID=UPI0013E35836|nr:MULTISPECIES: sugar ABC transporter permease [unclassified Mesorhizobium]